MVSASRSECALVASMGDGTCSQVEYEGLDFISMCGCLSIIGAGPPAQDREEDTGALQPGRCDLEATLEP